MGLFGKKRPEPEARFRMREKLISIGDDYWIENDQGERAFKVNGKAVRVRQTFVLEDPSGAEVARIQERKLSIRDKIAIERDGDTVATVHKALVGIRDRFAIDVDEGADMMAFLFTDDAELAIEDKAFSGLGDQVLETLDASIAALTPIEDAQWSTEAIESALREVPPGC